MHQNIPRKASRVLQVFALLLSVICLRVWYLSFIMHDSELEKAHKPQRKVVIEKAERATIHDRFGIPLAINKIQFNLSICYANIRQIPSSVWEKDKDGKNRRVYKRMEYIKELSAFLGKELSMSPVEIEDLIHGKASLFPHSYFIIKEDISEQDYYRLHMLEKDWIGIHAQKGTKRAYPKGKVGCDVIGYVGPISRSKYMKTALEMQELEDFIRAREENENPFLPKGFDHPLQVRDRLRDLEEKAYTINDSIGLAGVEAFYEEELRGLYGKKTYEIDIKGDKVRELPGSRNPISGRRINLTISSELQEFAEALLAANEGPQRGNDHLKIDENWIRGGSIVAMIPSTGEVVALASYPRFDPNDFISSPDKKENRAKAASVDKWLENKNHIGSIWDGRKNLQREYFSFAQNKYIEESLPLTWEVYLSAVLPKDGPTKTAMDAIVTIHDACAVQSLKEKSPVLFSIETLEDRLLITDLCALAVDPDLVKEPLLSVIKDQHLMDYHAFRQCLARIKETSKRHIQELYHDNDFTNWRDSHFKEYLAAKRKIEKKEKKHAKPYTDYLDNAQKSFFTTFWDTYHDLFFYTAICGHPPEALNLDTHLAPYMHYLQALHTHLNQQDPSLSRFKNVLEALETPLAFDYLKSMRSFSELNKGLLGSYKRVRSSEGIQTQKDLASAFYPRSGFGYGSSYAYKRTCALGSVFKLVTAYQSMMERYRSNQDLNPLTLIDDLKGDPRSRSLKQVLGYNLDGRPILRTYKGGILPRSSHSQIGEIELKSAIEQSSNIYFSLLASDHIKDPTSLGRAAHRFGFGEKTGIDLPGEVAGNIPNDLSHNRTGLYAFAIGQHSLDVTPLQTAVMLSTIASKGKVVKPKIVQVFSGLDRVHTEEALFTSNKFRFQKELSLVGIQFPLFTATQSNLKQGYVHYPPTQIKRSIAFPPEVFNIMTDSMQRVIKGSRGSARPGIMRNLYGNQGAIRDYVEMQNDLIAKTGTAQVYYKQSLDIKSLPEIRRHVWFATLSYPREKLLTREYFTHPELSVVVFLRFREGGREGGPIAAQLVKKWREICKKEQAKVRS